MHLQNSIDFLHIFIKKDDLEFVLLAFNLGIPNLISIFKLKKILPQIHLEACIFFI